MKNRIVLAITLSILILVAYVYFFEGAGSNIPPLVKEQIDRLSSEYPPMNRAAAAMALGKLKDSNAVKPLITTLKKDKDLTVLICAAEALGEIRDARAVDTLIEVLTKSTDPLLRSAAANALGEIGDARAVAPLVTVLLEDKGETNRMCELLKLKGVTVKMYVAKALGKIGTPAVKPLITALKEKDKEVRMYAAMVLGVIRDTLAVEPLVSTLKDQEKDVRTAALLALGDIKDTRAVEPIMETLRNGDSDIQRNAAEAMKKITRQDYGNDSRKWQDWWEKSKSK